MQEYLLNIISAIIEIPVEKLKSDFEIVTPHIGVNTNIIDSEVDLVYKNQDMYFSFEFNYNNYNELSNIPLDKIMKYTELTEKEVKEIIKEIENDNNQ